MKLVIKNFRGIKTADIETASITLIAGLNGAGKTSIIQAVQSTIAGAVIPVDGVPKSEALHMVHSGLQSGSVSASGESWSVEVTYPDTTRRAAGDIPSCSMVAAGIDSLLNYKTKERPAVIADLILAKPTKEDFIDSIHSALPTKDANKMADGIWPTVEGCGWDGAHERSKSTGTTLKGQWEGITKERYGTQKASSWLPRSWEADLHNKTSEELQAEVTGAKEWLEAAICESAVSVAEITRLTEASNRVPELTQKAEHNKASIDSLEKCAEQVLSAVRAIVLPDTSKICICPHCKAGVLVDNGKLYTLGELTEEEIARRKQAKVEAQESYRNIDNELSKLKADSNTLSGLLMAANGAAEKLKNISSKKPSENPATVDDCRAILSRAESRLEAHCAFAKASQLARQIADNSAIQGVLGASGVRFVVVTRRLEELNAKLRDMSEIAKWPTVLIMPNMGVSYNGRPFMLISESEQMRARYTLQIATACIDGSKVAILDRSDILDAAGRNGLMKLMSYAVKTFEMAFIVGMTLEKDKAPDMRNAGGITYIVKDGEVCQMNS